MVGLGLALRHRWADGDDILPGPAAAAAEVLVVVVPPYPPAGILLVVVLVVPSTVVLVVFVVVAVESSELELAVAIVESAVRVVESVAPLGTVQVQAAVVADAVRNAAAVVVVLTTASMRTMIELPK